MNKRNWANLQEVQGTPLEEKQMVEFIWTNILNSNPNFPNKFSIKDTFMNHKLITYFLLYEKHDKTTKIIFNSAENTKIILFYYSAFYMEDEEKIFIENWWKEILLEVPIETLLGVTSGGVMCIIEKLANIDNREQ